MTKKDIWIGNSSVSIDLEQFHTDLKLMASAMMRKSPYLIPTVSALLEFTNDEIEERRNETTNGDNQNGGDNPDKAVCERQAGS